ncbi:amidase family protein [Pantoea agglomerans]|uniref:amidase family protein n=1 Tax=Enterobacter agglomerans TaxID=549 RepID=UPI0037C917D7
MTWNDYMTGFKSIELLRACWYQMFTDLKLDAIIYPTVCCEVPRVEDADTPEVFHKLIRNTDIASSVGAPSLTFPVAHRGGMSVGLSLDGLPKADRKVISQALAIEAILQR